MSIHSYRNVLVALLAITSVGANCQSISGRVHDNNLEPVPFANILLLTPSDSVLVKGIVTDSLGNFHFDKTVRGNYLLTVSMTGFQKHFEHISIAGDDVTLSPITLSEDVTQLDDVVVTGKRLFVEQYADRTIVNVANSIVSGGNNALEVLAKAPGLSVDPQNDVLRLRGKDGVLLQVDGKQTYLSMQEIVTQLRGMSSDRIDRIEIITNPPAGTDASGNAGIVNIILKKSDDLGFNGSVSAGIVQGITPKANANGAIHFRSRKVDFFVNAGVNQGKYQTNIIADRIQHDTIFNQTLEHISDSRNINASSGVNFFLGRHTLGVMTSGNTRKEHWTSVGDTEIFFEPTGEYLKHLVATNTIERDRRNMASNINYRFATVNGFELSFDADNAWYRFDSRSFQPNYYFDNGGNAMSEIITRNHTPTQIDIYTAKLDTRIPINKMSDIRFGGKSSYVATDNIFEFFNEKNGALELAPDRSYSFKYKENVNALFVALNSQVNDRLAIQAGVRTEQTISTGDLKRSDGVQQEDEVVSRNYIDLFPTARLAWTVNADHSLSIGYNRRIDRPTYQELNPFEIKMDELTYVKGNAFLRPQYTDNASISHSWKQKISSEIGYSYIADFVTMANDTVRNTTYVQQKNLGTKQIISASISGNFQPQKWWSLTASLWFNYQMLEGQINDKPVKLSMPVYGTSVHQVFTLGKGYTLESIAWVNGPSLLVATWRSKTLGAIDIGVQKSLMKNKATLKFSVTDVFRTSIPFRTTNNFGGLILNAVVATENQTVRLSFNYHFGNNKVKSVQHQQGLENESKRVRDN